MKRLIINILALFSALLCCSAAERGVAFVETREAGELERLLGDELLTVEELTVRGPVNEADFMTLRRSTSYGCLEYLNLADAVVEGGRIPDYAFACSKEPYIGHWQADASLWRVILPDNVEEIGSYAFFQARKLESVEFPPRLKMIQSDAFSGCISLKDTLCLPEGLVEVGHGAFSYCEKLRSVVCPVSLRSIGANAFEYSGLEHIVLQEGLESIGESAFGNCHYLEEAVIPNSVGMLGWHAFVYDFSLERLILPDGLKEIPMGAFRECHSLRSVELPATVRRIEGGAFESCRSLETVVFNEGLEEIGDEAFLDCCMIRSLSLPSSVVKLGRRCFYMSRSLEMVVCSSAEPPAYTPSEYYSNTTPFGAIDGQTDMYETSRELPVYIPVGCGESYRSANGWRYFSNFIEVPDPQSATLEFGSAIEPYDCSARIGQVVAGTLEERLGVDMYKVDSLVVGGQLNAADIATLFNMALNGSLMYLDMSGAAIEGGIIPEKAFYYDRLQYKSMYDRYIKLREIILPDDVVEIGRCAFSGAVLLKRAKLPSGLKRIGASAFGGCLSLCMEPDLFPDALETISDGAFAACKHLNAVELPGQVREIGNDAFRESGLYTLSVEEGGSLVIGENAFCYCNHLRDITIGQHQNSEFGHYVFFDCANLERLVLPDGLLTVPPYAMYGCQMLKDVSMPSTVECIDQSAFCDCLSISALQLNDGLKSIHRWAYQWCVGIKKIELPATIEKLEVGCFANIPGLEQLVCKAGMPPSCAESQQDLAKTPFGAIDDSADEWQTPRDIPVYVPRGSAEAYRSAPGWNYFTNFIETDEFPEAGIDGSRMEDGAVEVRVESGRMVLAGNGAAASDYAVHTIDGRQVAAGRVSCGDAVVSVAPGLYIVAVGATAVKVFVP